MLGLNDFRWCYLLEKLRRFPEARQMSARLRGGQIVGHEARIG